MRSIKKFALKKFSGGGSKKSQYWDGNKWTFSLGNLKAIIDLKEEDIPERYKKDIDKCFDQIHYDKVRKTGENVLLFDIFPSDINGKPVVRIGKNVFKNNSNIEKVVIGINCKTIGEGCFENCVNIRYVDVPSSLVNIEPKAFSGCSGISALNLSSVKHIGTLAFHNCTELGKIYLSEQCGTIEKDAFLYAEQNGLRTQPV